MQIAAAMLAGAAVFFAGFCLGNLPPAKPFPAGKTRAVSAGQNKHFENFLNYNGEVQP